VDRPTVPAAPGGSALRMVPVPAEFLPVLESAACWQLALKCGAIFREFDKAGGTPSRHVADLLVAEVQATLDARVEIIAAAVRSDGAVRLDVVELIGPEAINREHHRIAGMWEEGSDDYQALAEHTTRLRALERLILLAGKPA
jgi:hypothetical protein